MLCVEHLLRLVLSLDLYAFVLVLYLNKLVCTHLSTTGEYICTCIILFFILPNVIRCNGLLHFICTFNELYFLFARIRHYVDLTFRTHL